MKLWNAIKYARELLANGDATHVEIHKRCRVPHRKGQYVIWRTMTKPLIFEEGGQIGLIDLDDEYRIHF